LLVAGPCATSQATGDLACEVTGVLSWMCAGLSGCRWARGRAEKAVAAVSG
jgi:hypothetical protein